MTNTTPAASQLIDLGANLSKALPAELAQRVGTLLERILSLDRINTIHHRITGQPTPGQYCQAALKALKIRYTVSRHDLVKIPAHGPLVVVANHPFGGVEGVILTHLLSRVRKDVKIMGNHLLHHIPDLSKTVIPVDLAETGHAIRRNRSSLRQMLSWLGHGGSLITFPAGVVSHFHPRQGKITDPAWSPHIAALAHKTGARVLPIYIPGHNSILFQCLGLVHPRLRTLWLARELIRSTGRNIPLCVGRPLGPRELSRFATDADRIAYLRFVTYFMSHRLNPHPSIVPFKLPARMIPVKSSRRPAKQAPVVGAGPKAARRAEIGRLEARCRLHCHKDFAVYLVEAPQIPSLLEEIGRLREATFRSVGEGTGSERDLDPFDNHYRHLLLWDRKAEEVAGAYRLGEVQTIVSQRGLSGLYTYSLFQFKPTFIDTLGPSLELGRAFIRPRYQRKFGCLPLLWRGIGAFIAQNPEYRSLFGPVSITQDYTVISRNLMIQYLRCVRGGHPCAGMVSPRTPVRTHPWRDFKRPVKLLKESAVEDISRLVSEIESDGKGIPTLMKHYLSLDAQFIGFNRDKAFSNAIDGLVVVDLLNTEKRLLKRFLGDEGTQAFYAYHQGQHPGGQEQAA